MKKYLYISICMFFLFSCNGNIQQENIENKKTGLSEEEKVFYGYNEDLVYDSSINAKIVASNDKELDKFVASLKGLGVQEIRRSKAFADGEMFLHLKAYGNYPKTLAKIRKMEGVLYAEPNYKMDVIGSFEGKQNNGLNPFDLSSGGDLSKDSEANIHGYSLEITKALKAYKELGYGTNTVWAGIIDTGTNANHEDFKNSSGTTIVEVLKDAFKNYNNVTTGNTDTDPDAGGHGTHCSGIICALGDNNKGIAGVAWKNVKLLSYNGAGNALTTYGSLKDLTDTVRKMVPQEKQATVPVNMSLGRLTAGNFDIENLNYALSKGVLPVVANGNDGRLIASYPAAYPGVLAVGATGDNDKKGTFSTYGPWLNIVAPGFEIISLDATDTNKYKHMSGTSQAAPFITGTIAYLLSFNPHLTPYQIISILEKTADKIDSNNKHPMAKYDDNGFSLWYGHGRVNVLKAAKMVKEGNVPEKGKEYVETVLKVKTKNVDSLIHVYDKKTGVLVNMSLPYGFAPNIHSDIRGLRPGVYNVVYQGNSQEVTIGKDKDVEIQF
ncbi:MAG: S8 family serine peptidase [Treponema sp.]